MKRYFLYTPRDSEAFRRFEEYLRSQPIPGQLVTLPPGTGLTSSQSLEMRSNDPLVLFAATAAEMDELLKLSEDCGSFKLALVVNDGRLVGPEVHRRLTPRLICAIATNIDDLPPYLAKILLYNPDTFQGDAPC